MANQTIGIGLIGLGTVGKGVVALLEQHEALYTKRFGQAAQICRVLVRDVDKAKASGEVDASLLTDDPATFFGDDNIKIVVEVAGGVAPMADFVRQALTTGRHVVTANKALLADQGPELFALARKHDVSIAFEASCGGGIPCITALTQGLMANHMTGMYGILNGTCNFILSQMTQLGQSYEAALAEAQELGYAEADPTLDVTGQDAAQKLAVLASLAFDVQLAGDQVHCSGIDQLHLQDIGFGAELGYDIKLLASAERWPGQEWMNVEVQPCFIKLGSLLAQVGGPFNALQVYGDAVGPTLFYGQGAGRFPTASAVVNDLMSIVAGVYPQAFKQLQLTPDCNEPASLIDPADTESPYYLRMDALDQPGVMAEVTSILGKRNISLSAVLQHESREGNVVPLVVTTHKARRGDIEEAVGEIAALEHIQGQPVIIRVMELPED